MAPVASAPPRALTPVEALWFSSGVSFWVLTRHITNAERARDAQPEPVAARVCTRKLGEGRW